MALIHEELYMSADLARIDFVGYIRRLAEHLFESFGIDAQRIDLTIEIDDVLLTIDHERDRIRSHRPTRLKLPQRPTGARVERKEIPFPRSGEHQTTRRRHHSRPRR